MSPRKFVTGRDIRAGREPHRSLRGKKCLPDRESNPGLPRDRRRSSPLDYRGLDCVHSAKIIAWLRKWILSSQLELSWWERRILCYPAYTGLNCSHIRWPYSGQSEHSTDHHITCTHSGLSLVSYLWLYRGQVSRGKEVSHTLALYTENWKQVIFLCIGKRRSRSQWYSCCICLLAKKRRKNMHRPGIEPGPPAWQASILPLNQRCIWCCACFCLVLFLDNI